MNINDVMNIFSGKFDWLLREINGVETVENIEHYLYESLKNKEYGVRYIYAFMYFVSLTDKSLKNDKIKDDMVELIKSKDQKVKHVFEAIIDEESIQDFVQENNLLSEHLNSLIDYCHSNHEYFHNYSENIKLLLRYYDKFKELYNYEDDYIDSLYSNISSAGDRSDYGYDFEGLDTIKEYIKFLDRGLLEKLLRKYEAFACNNYWKEYYITDMMKKQMLTIIVNSVKDEKDAYQLKYRFLDKVIITNSVVSSIFSSFNECKGFNDFLEVSEKKVTSFDEKIEFKYIHKNHDNKVIKICINHEGVKSSFDVVYEVDGQEESGFNIINELKNDNRVKMTFKSRYIEREGFTESFKYNFKDSVISHRAVGKTIDEQINYLTMETICHKVFENTIDVKQNDNNNNTKTDDACKVSVSKQLDANTNEDEIVMLHLSDLHLTDFPKMKQYLTTLNIDLYSLGVKKIDYLIISGDISNTATRGEFEVGANFIIGIKDKYNIDISRIIIVPGNHDVDRKKSKEAYCEMSSITEEFPKSNTMIFQQFNETSNSVKSDEGKFYIDLFMVKRNEEKYKERFRNFNDYLYKKIFSNNNEEYSMEYEKQNSIRIIRDDKIVFLMLNSCWQLDHYYKERASINMEGLSLALDELLENVDEMDDYLKIAVSHHPVTGKNAMDNSFMQLLTLGGFKLYIQGHLHKSDKYYFCHDDCKRMHIIGAGTFGAPENEQVTSIPLQYNIITYSKSKKKIFVKSRKREDRDGAWKADARWGDSNSPESLYEISL